MHSTELHSVGEATMRSTDNICGAYNLVRKFRHLYTQLLLHKIDNRRTVRDAQHSKGTQGLSKTRNRIVRRDYLRGSS